MQQRSSHLLQERVWQTPHVERAQGVTPRRCSFEHLVLLGTVLWFRRAFGSPQKGRFHQIFRSGLLQTIASESRDFETQFAPAQRPGAHFAVAFQSYVLLCPRRASLRDRFACPRDSIEQVPKGTYPFKIKDISRWSSRTCWVEICTCAECKLFVSFHHSGFAILCRQGHSIYY